MLNQASISPKTLSLSLLLVFGVAFTILSALGTSTKTALGSDGQERADDNASRKGFRIGVLLPLTGEFSNASAALRNGIEAASQLYGHSLVLEDDGGMISSRAVVAVSKLVYHDRVDIVVLSSFDLVPSVAPILERAGVPSIVLWDSNKELRDRYRLVFGIGYSPEHAGIVLGRFALECLAVSSVGIISAQARWSIAMADSFKGALQSAATSIIVEESVTVEDTEFRAQLARILAKNPDVIFAPLYTRGAVSFIRQARNLGYSGRILTGEVLFDSELQSLGRYAEGTYLTNAWLAPAALKTFSAVTGEYSVPDAARFSLAFDSVTLAERYRLAHKRFVNPERAMRSIAFTGVTGEISFFASKESARTQPVMNIEGGAFRVANCQPHAEM